MSTKLNDVPSAAVLASTVPPVVATSNQTGSTVDLISADGPGFALLAVGAIAVGTTVGGKVQESDTGSSWTDIAGATFPAIIAANGTGSARFHRTARYVRCAITVTGGSPSAAVCARIGSQKKTM